jgi:hypothetical protein
MIKSLGLALLGLGALGLAASAEPVKLTKSQLDQVVAGKITQQTTNPGQQSGGCSNNPNCTTVNVNPTGKAPSGQNK